MTQPLHFKGLTNTPACCLCDASAVGSFHDQAARITYYVCEPHRAAVQRGEVDLYQAVFGDDEDDEDEEARQQQDQLLREQLLEEPEDAS